MLLRQTVPMMPPRCISEKSRLFLTPAPSVWMRTPRILVPLIWLWHRLGSITIPWNLIGYQGCGTDEPRLLTGVWVLECLDLMWRLCKEKFDTFPLPNCAGNPIMQLDR